MSQLDLAGHPRGVQSPSMGLAGTDQAAHSEPSSRRRFLRHSGVALGAALLGPALAACSRDEPPLRIASSVFLAYELFFLARDRGYFDAQAVRLVEMPAATASMQALAAGTVEGAALTLDEVLSAVAGAIDLKVVAVVDVSHGADALVAQPELTRLEALKGRRIGVEQTALGALMVAATLKRAGLKPSEVEIVPLGVNEHRPHFVARRVDAVITLEPFISQLVDAGGRLLFSSADIPGMVVDVLAIRAEALAQSPRTVEALIAGFFRARGDLFANPAAASAHMAPRLELEPAQVEAAFRKLDLPDLSANRAWLAGKPSPLENSATRVAELMVQARLLPHAVATTGLADPGYLGAA